MCCSCCLTQSVVAGQSDVLHSSVVSFWFVESFCDASLPVVSLCSWFYGLVCMGLSATYTGEKSVSKNIRIHEMYSANPKTTNNVSRS